jgi:hypothetical protein
VLLDPATRGAHEQAMEQARYEASGAGEALMEKIADEVFEKTGVDVTKLEESESVCLFLPVVLFRGCWLGCILNSRVR